MAKIQRYKPKKVWNEDKKRSSFHPTAFSAIAQKVFRDKGYDETREIIFQLYAHWEMVMGEDLYQLALPIGHRGKILLIAGEDNLVLNELTYMLDEIKERVNAFMGQEFFEKIELHLLQNKRPLNEAVEIYPGPEKVELIRPENLGSLNLPEGKVRDAYLHYLSIFND